MATAAATATAATLGDDDHGDEMDNDELLQEQQKLGALQAQSHCRFQLTYLRDELGDDAHKIIVELASSVDGCRRLRQALESGNAHAFVAGIISRRRADAATEAAVSARSAALDKRLAEIGLQAAWHTEKPWYAR